MLRRTLSRCASRLSSRAANCCWTNNDDNHGSNAYRSGLPARRTRWLRRGSSGGSDFASNSAIARRRSKSVRKISVLRRFSRAIQSPARRRVGSSTYIFGRFPNCAELKQRVLFRHNCAPLWMVRERKKRRVMDMASARDCGNEKAFLPLETSSLYGSTAAFRNPRVKGLLPLGELPKGEVAFSRHTG